MADPFTKVPVELSLIILKAVPDLASLCSLIQASRIMSMVFKEWYDEVAEAVLALNYPPESQRVIRTLLEIRTNPSATARGLDSLPAICRYLNDHLGSSADSSPLVKPSSRFSAVQTLLYSAAHIQQVSVSFFETHLKRLNSIKPSHLVDPTFCYTEPSQPEPEGLEYELLKGGSPSWVEEYRVSRSLWGQLLTFEFRDFIKANVASDSELWHLGRPVAEKRITDLLQWMAVPDDDELLCVGEYLWELPELTRWNWCSLDAPECSPSTKPSAVAATAGTNGSHGGVTRDLSWDERITAISGKSPGVTSFDQQRNRALSPLKGLSWDPFRRLGFSIWDLERLVAMELLNDDTKDKSTNTDSSAIGAGKNLSVGNLAFTWRSILGADAPWDPW